MYNLGAVREAAIVYIMKRIITLLILWAGLTGSSAFAVEISEETVSLGNQMIQTIYNEIFVQKWNHPELKDFNASVFKRGKLGFHHLYYRFDEYLSIRRGELYHFGMTINEIGDDNPFDLVGRAFRYVYPVLGVQVVGAKADTISKRKQFDFQPIVEKTVKKLWEYEQTQLPYQLELNSKRSILNVGERLRVEVSLTNMLNKKQKLKNLGPNILQFHIDERLYGPPEFDVARMKRAKTLVYKPNQTKKRTITLKGFNEPGIYEISCSYLLPYKGVFPQDVIQVEVVE